MAWITSARSLHLRQTAPPRRSASSQRFHPKLRMPATPRRILAHRGRMGAIVSEAADIDEIFMREQIAKLLREGEKHESIHRRLGASYSLITKIRAELGLAGQTGPRTPRLDELPPPHIDRKAEPANVSARVPCIVAGEEIGARECIARQCERKCFCPKASFAINAVAPHVLPGTRLEDQLASCRAVARSVLTKPLDERFLGPALQAFRGETVEQSLIAGDLPAPPNHEPEPAPVEVKPPPPAKEKAVPEEHVGRSVLDSITDTRLREKFAAAPTIAQLRADLGCGYNMLRARLGALGLKKAHGGDRRSVDAAPKTVDDVAKKHLRKSATPAPMVPPDRYVAPNVDIVQLLEQQHAHHTRELGRIGKALAALKE